MKEFYKAVDAILAIINLIMLAVGVIYILYIGPDKLFDDPIYVMLVIIFYYLISKKFHKD